MINDNKIQNKCLNPKILNNNYFTDLMILHQMFNV